MELLLGILMVSAPFVINLSDYINEGRHCVNAVVQVGDTVQTHNGRKFVVTELHGTSLYCSNPELPVKATTTPVDKLVKSPA